MEAGLYRIADQIALIRWGTRRRVGGFTSTDTYSVMMSVSLAPSLGDKAKDFKWQVAARNFHFSALATQPVAVLQYLAHSK